MKECLLVTTILALVAVLAAGCAGAASPITTPGPIATAEQVNFRFLISDEVSDIGDFAHLDVVISRICVHQGGESGTWHEPAVISEDPDGDGRPGIDLTQLKGENALVLWEDTLPPGEYTKVFIDIDMTQIDYELNTGGTADVKLPSEKLQISKPFTISENGDQVVNFVYDITVVKAGKSGKYILKPQIAQSGPGQDFKEVPPSGQAGKSNAAYLYLRQKNPETWEIVEGGAWGKLKYNLSGSTFSFVFNGHGLEPNTEYSLIYYADFEDRLTNWGGNNPGALIAGGTSNEDGDIHLAGSVELNMDLPSPPDANIDVHDYSGPPDYYAHAHGAKIWLVPSADYDAGLFKVTTWDPSAFLFETDLINYDDTDVP